MVNDRAYNQQPGNDNAEETGSGRKEQFNELSELSLEERMKVAGQLGVPVYNAGDAAATGTMSSSDDAENSLNEGIENENTGERTAP